MSDERPSWGESWIAQAKELAKRSKDPSSKVGCILVDRDNDHISQGYNGFVAKCDESKMTFERPLKYNLTIHAEMNAILRVKDRETLVDSTAYVTDAPCDNCLKHMLQAKIRKIVYNSPKIMVERSSCRAKRSYQTPY